LKLTASSETPAAVKTLLPSILNSSRRESRKPSSKLLSNMGFERAKSILTGETKVPKAERTLALTGKMTLVDSSNSATPQA
jgi:hypothetical protein